MAGHEEDVAAVGPPELFRLCADSRIGAVGHVEAQGSRAPGHVHGVALTHQRRGVVRSDDGAVAHALGRRDFVAHGTSALEEAVQLGVVPLAVEGRALGPVIPALEAPAQIETVTVAAVEESRQGATLRTVVAVVPRQVVGIHLPNRHPHNSKNTSLDE